MTGNDTVKQDKIAVLAWDMATNGMLEELLKDGLSIDDALQSLYDLAQAGLYPKK